MRRTPTTCSTMGRSKVAPSLLRTTNGPCRLGTADDGQLGLGADRTHPPCACGCHLPALDHPRRAGAAHTAAEADQPGLPGRLDLRAGRVDGDLRRGVQPAGRAEQGADVGLLAANRNRDSTYRVWCLPLADAQAIGPFASLDEEDHQCHPGSGGGHRGGVGGGESQGALHLCGSRFGYWIRGPRNHGCLDFRVVLCPCRRVFGRDPGTGLRRGRRAARRAADPAQRLDGATQRRAGGGHPGDHRSFGAVQGHSRPVAMMARVVARLEVVDPGFARTRHGARTACATVLSGLTLALVTSMFGVAEPLQITLFGARACFFGALLVTDPHRSDRAHTFGWAAVVSAVAIVVTAELSRTAVWAAVALLVLQMFLSYALRSWSLRAGNLAVIGALITFLAGAGLITSNRIVWFVLASTVGFAWVTVSEYVILPDDPVRSLKRSGDVFCRSAGDAVASVVDTLTTTCDGNAPDHAAKALRRSLDRVMRCRTAIESQVSGAGFGRHDVEQLRV